MKSTLFVRGGLLLSALIFAGAAFAQDAPMPRRGETGDAPPIVEGGHSPWSFVRITGQPLASTLGALAVDATGGVYVWSMRREYWPVLGSDEILGDIPLPRRTEPGTPSDVAGPGLPPLIPGNEGGLYPAPRREESGDADPVESGGNMVPLPGVMKSTLYFGDGVNWAPALEVTGETGASVFISGTGDVFVATDLPDGGVRVRRLHCGQWRKEYLPHGVTGPAGAFAGGDPIYFRTGAAVLRRVDGHWNVVQTCGEMAGCGGLVYVNRPEPRLHCESHQVMAFCEGHDHVYDGERWTVNDESLPTHVHGAWAGRDDQGVLHMFAAGANPAHSGMRIFDFVEADPGTLCGEFHCDVEQPLHCGCPGSKGNRMWGSQVHDVYATGVALGEGQLYRFDGMRWWSAAPEHRLPTTIDVGGTPWGDLWVSLADGRLLHRKGGEPTILPVNEPPMPGPGIAPTVAVALPTEARLVVRGGRYGTADMELSLPVESDVTLSVFDLAGRRVETLRQDRLRAGVHPLTWNAARVASGVYFCRLDAGPVRITKRVLIHR